MQAKRARRIVSGWGGAALALLLAFSPADAAAADGAWAERVQVLYQAETRSVVRAKLRVWDFHPGLNLDFTWEPAAGETAALGPDGTVNGEGRLVWRVRGSASYDPQTVFSSYSGRLADGRPNGWGRLALRSGEIFEGTFRDGLLDGEGTHVDEAGNRYDGVLRDGVPEGRGRLMLTTGEVYSGPFRDGLREGSGETLLPGGTRYTSQWAQGVERAGARPDALADAGVGGLLKADSTGGSAGRVELSVALDGRMNQQSVENNGMSYAQTVRDEDIAIYPQDQDMNAAWNGTGEVTTSAYAFDRFEWDSEPAFVEVGVKTTDGKRVRLDDIKLDVATSQAYRKPMLSLIQHKGCVGFRPTFSIVNHGWGDPRNTVLSVQFTGETPDGPASRAFSVPVADFSKGIDVSIDGALREAGVDTAKLAAKRYPCRSKEGIDVCRAQMFNDVGFGEVADYVWSGGISGEEYSTTATGRIDYDWSDDAGQTYHASEKFRVDIALATIEISKELAECGDGFGGSPEARRYQDVHLEPGRDNYSIDLPIRGNRNVSSFQARLKVFAPMSSFHQFRVAARFADGSVRESKPVTLYFYRPRPSDFVPATAPASCYLSEVVGGC